MTGSATAPDAVRGRLRITERAVRRIVAVAVGNVPGTLSLERSLDRLAARSWPRYDVLLNDAAGTVSIEVFIAVTWPSPVTAVAEAVRGTVANRVEELTGLQVTHVNVVVGPVVTGEHVRRVTREQLDDRPRLPRPRPVGAPPPRIRQPRTKVTAPLRPVRTPTPARLRPVTVIPLDPGGPRDR